MVGAALLANGIVGAVVAAYNVIGTPPPGNGVSLQFAVAIQDLALIPFIPAFVWACNRVFTPVHSWLAKNEPASTSDIEVVLRQPQRQALGGLVLWLVDTPIAMGTDGYFYPSGTFSLRYTLAVGAANLLSGVVATTLCFVLVERAMRPAYEVALRNEAFDGRSGGFVSRMIVLWMMGSGVVLLIFPVIVLQLAPKSGAQQLQSGIAYAAGAGFAVSLGVTVLWARSLGTRLNAIRNAMLRVRTGDYQQRLPIDDAGELGQVQSGFNQMVDDLRERERIRELFSQQVGEEAARHAIDQGPQWDAQRRQVSVLFVDVIGSTALTERLSPEEMVLMQNTFFETVVATVMTHGGWVNKFMGDGALAIFGAPDDQPDHATRALRAGRDLGQRITSLKHSMPNLDAAIGIATGEVVAGNIGSGSGTNTA